MPIKQSDILRAAKHIKSAKARPKVVKKGPSVMGVPNPALKGVPKFWLNYDLAKRKEFAG